MDHRMTNSACAVLVAAALALTGCENLDPWADRAADEAERIEEERSESEGVDWLTEELNEREARTRADLATDVGAYPVRDERETRPAPGPGPERY
jgi:hypothetical protein